MKIKDVVIKEMGSRGYVPPKNQQGPAPTLDDGGGYDAMGNPTSSMPSASPTNVAATTPKGGAAGQAKWPTTAAEIKAFQTANKLKADGLIGAKTMAALQKSGATPPPGFKPVGSKQASTKQPAKQPATNAPAADPTKDPYDPNKDTNVKMTPQSEIQAAQSDADKKAAISGNLPPVAAAPATPSTGPNAAPTNTAVDPSIGAGQNLAYLGQLQKQKDAMADFQRLAGITPTVNNQSSSYAQPPSNDENPAGQAAQPRDASTVPPAALGQRTSPEVNPDTGASTVAPPVKTGTGGTLTTSDGKPVTSRSDDEIAWANANPQNRYNPNGYPGPGNWDPRTGRSKKEAEQGQKNLDAVKGFLNKINPFASKQQDAGPTGNVNNQSSGYTQPQQESADLAILRKLSGLK